MRDIEKCSRYIMANLDEFLYGEKSLFEDYVSIDVLYEVKRKLKNEFNALLDKINYYKRHHSFNEMFLYKEEMQYLKTLINDFDKVVAEYIRENKKKKRTFVGSNNNSSCKNNYSINKVAKNNSSEDEDISLLINDKYLVEILLGLRKGKCYTKEDILKTMENCSDELNRLFVFYAKDILKYLYRRTSKDDIKTREAIRKQKKIFDSIILVEKYEEKCDTSIYYDILESLLYNDCNYVYIKELLSKISSFKFARKNNQHILIKILDKFIYNYKLKLADQNFDFIEPSFYKEIIKLFFDKDFSLLERDKIVFEEMLNEFKNYHLVSKGIHTDVINDIKDIEDSILGSNINNSTDTSLLDEFNRINKINMEQTISYYYSKGVDVKGGFIFDKSSNFAFSISYLEDGSPCLDIHLLDTSKIFDKDSKLFDFVKDYDYEFLKFSKNGIYPTLTFSYILFNNKFNVVSINPNILIVRDVYDDNDLDNYRMKLNLKEMIRIFTSINQKYDRDINFYEQEGIEKFSKFLISTYITNAFNKDKIPFIYKDYLDSDEDLIRVNHNKVCNLLYKLPNKKEAHLIFDIMDCHSESFYVPVASSKSELVLDTNSFLGFYLLDIIHQIMGGKYDSMAEIESIEIYLHELNNRKTYLPKIVMKDNKIKLKRLARDIKRKVSKK